MKKSTVCPASSYCQMLWIGDLRRTWTGGVLLHRHEDDACRGEGVEDGDDLTQRPDILDIESSRVSRADCGSAGPP